MTASRHTPASLVAMSDRELDAAVASIVFCEAVDHVEFPGGATEWVMEQAVVPCYTAYWQGVGEIVERMRPLGFSWIVQIHSLGSAAGFQRESRLINFGSKDSTEEPFVCEFKGDAELFRAVAIASVLAVQGAA